MIHETNNDHLVVGHVSHRPSEPGYFPETSSKGKQCKMSNITTQVLTWQGKKSTNSILPITIWRVEIRWNIWPPEASTHVGIEASRTVLFHPRDISPLRQNLKQDQQIHI